MTARVYPRERVEGVLTKVKLPASYRIFLRHHLETPLGITPGDSRFCASADGNAVLYATPDFATAFIEVILRDRFTRKRQREVSLKEITERAWARIVTKPQTKVALARFAQRWLCPPGRTDRRRQSPKPRSRTGVG